MKRLRLLILYFTYQERKKRQYKEYDKERKKLESLTNRQLDFEYIEVKNNYQYKKNIYSLFLGTLLLATLTKSNSIFYETIHQIGVVYKDVLGTQGEAWLRITMIVYISVSIIFVLTIFIVIVSYLTSLKNLHKKILLIEEIKQLTKN
ncbi:hypothetical protein ELZ39_11350 [Enterococcus faecalis]|nr:hypothetical protein [Enterococcus faecalis]